MIGKSHLKSRCVFSRSFVDSPTLCRTSRRFELVVAGAFQRSRDHRPRHEYQQEDWNGELEGQDDRAERSKLPGLAGRV